MTGIKIEHQLSRKEWEKLVEWASANIPSMKLELHKIADGKCWFEATSGHPMDFYKLGVFTAIHIRALKDREAKRQAKAAQEN